MYCDFCGQKILYNAKYCRSCGHELRDSAEDTQPVPVISETMLHSGLHHTHIPWYKTILPGKLLINRNHFRKVLYDTAAFVLITALLYILVTFKTVWDYQVLTVMWGSVLLCYIWWKR
jgi:predicted amidophosphoribosyltransferase